MITRREFACCINNREVSTDDAKEIEKIGGYPGRPLCDSDAKKREFARNGFEGRCQPDFKDCLAASLPEQLVSLEVLDDAAVSAATVASGTSSQDNLLPFLIVTLPACLAI